MAVIYPDFDESGFESWLATRPPLIQELGRKIRPNRLYRFKDSGQRCYVYSWSEDGTVTVVVDGQFNVTLFDRQVFGVNPDTLEECDLPPADEHHGAILSSAEVDEHLDTLRVMVRPDLWEMDESGHAKRRPQRRRSAR